MEIRFDTDAANRVWDAMKRINEAWVSGHPEKIGALLHPDCVMASPVAGQHLQGSEAVARSYIEYTKMARTLSFSVTHASVDLFGEAAMVSATFEMTYVLQEKTYRSSGRDIWLFKHIDGAWHGAWRSLADLYEEEA